MENENNIENEQVQVEEQTQVVEETSVEVPAQQSNSEETSNDKSKKKKKRNPFVRFILFLLKFILALILIIAAWCTFSALDKKKSIKMIPQGYAAYLHTDSLYDCVRPLLDLRAAEIFLSDSSMSDIRGIFMMLRESEWRDNPVVKTLVSRKIDAALYSQNDNLSTFVASVDLGVLSSVTRLANFVLPKLPIEDLSLISTGGLQYFEFKSGNNVFYFKPYRNLIIASNDLNYFIQALKANNDENYTKDQLQLLTKKVDDPIKLIIDAKGLVSSFTKNNAFLEKITSILSEDNLSILSFGINDREINLNVDISTSVSPETANDETKADAVKLVTTNSTVPEIVTAMSSAIQYYTVLNVGTLEQLKNTFFPLMPEKNLDGLWKTGNSVAKPLLGVTLDDLLFSWTGKELAILGVEGLNDPVFAIEITNESKRKEVFDSIFSSFLLNENKSLILNGVRIPRMELPSFFNSILKALKVDLPKPYYLVYNNYVYFSQSAESISRIYQTFSGGTNISYNPNYKNVTNGKQKEASISLFYDLERSRPFFITSNSSLSKILELYTIGKTDISIEDGHIKFHLKASSKNAGSLKNIPGFPVELKASHGNAVVSAPVSKPTTIFWLENGQTIKAMDVKKTKTYIYQLPKRAVIKAVSFKQREQLAALTEDNEFYLFNEKLEPDSGYPVKFTGEQIDEALLSADISYVPLINGTVTKIASRKTSEINFNLDEMNIDNITAWYDGNCGVIYKRGFTGKIFVLIDGKCINEDSPIMIDKICYGHPAIFKIDNNKYSIAFVTLQGLVKIYTVENNEAKLTNSIQLDGLYYLNLKAADGFYYAVSSTGLISKISAQNDEITSVQIDNVSVKEGILDIQSVNKHTIISVGIDGNLIYAFNDNLELESGFPIAGTGVPAFADVNGDNYPDCFAVTVDNKLNAWNLR